MNLIIVLSNTEKASELWADMNNAFSKDGLLEFVYKKPTATAVSNVVGM